MHGAGQQAADVEIVVRFYRSAGFAASLQQILRYVFIWTCFAACGTPREVR
jgi:hypothetical protein